MVHTHLPVPAVNVGQQIMVTSDEKKSGEVLSTPHLQPEVLKHIFLVSIM